MTRKFWFDADLKINEDGEIMPLGSYSKQTRLHVWIDIACTDRDGCDATYNIEAIIQPNGEMLTEEQLTEHDLTSLERLCQSTADDYAPEAYQEYAEFAADAAYERWKDDLMSMGD